VSDIEPDPNQPRRHFDEDALEELARSIAQRGVIQPVIVRPVSAGRYQLVAGERRWRAAARARPRDSGDRAQAR
jgi:ParB family chromosome partitioning protein